MLGYWLLLPALVSLVSLVSLAGARRPPAYLAAPHSAASDAQIKFAQENKYDDTGPGAKGPQYAYAAYKTLDDALVAYLNDPDTKLPELERERVIQKLSQGLESPGTQAPYEAPVVRFYPKTVEEYTGYRKPEDKASLLLTKISPKKHYQPFVFQGGQLKKLHGAEPYKVTKIHHGSNPVSVAHYSRGSTDHVYSHPNYQFTFDVHVPETSRGGDQSRPKLEEQLSVPGHSFLDQSAAQRSLQYGSDHVAIGHPDQTKTTRIDLVQPPHLGQVRPPHLSDQISLLESQQRYLQYNALLRAKQEQENLPQYSDQVFVGSIDHGPQRRPVTYGDQLFESRIEQGNPQYLQKRQADTHTVPSTLV